MDAKTLCVMLLSVLVAGATRGLNEDLPGLRDVSKGARALLLSGLAILGAAAETFAASHATFWSALGVAFGATGPSFVMLLVEVLFGGGRGPAGDEVVVEKSEQPSSYSARMMAHALVALCLAVPACTPGAQRVVADVGSVAGTIVADVQQAEAWVRLVEDVADVFFRVANLPDEEAKYRQAKQALDLSILGLTRLGTGVVDAAGAEYKKAVEDFRAAYEAFVGAARSVGIVSARGVKSYTRDGKMRAVEQADLRLLAGK